MTELNDSQAKWVAVATFSTGLEADMARQSLEAEGIPVLVNSTAPGIFGASFQGSVTGGISLQVPSPVVTHARAILDGTVVDDSDDDYTP
jgi:hypothetical protein